MTTPAIIVPGAVVCPMRFTERAEQIIAFFELLGLHTASRQGSFAVLHGRGGRIAVHPLQTAESISQTLTSLVLEVPDALVAAERLAESGLSTSWWDESFGRQASVVSPMGQLSLNGELDDPYGYQVFDPAPFSSTSWRPSSRPIWTPPPGSSGCSASSRLPSGVTRATVL